MNNYHLLLSLLFVFNTYADPGWEYVALDKEIKIARDMYNNSIFLDELPYRDKIVEDLKTVHSELKNIYFNPNGEHLIEGLIQNSPQVNTRKELVDRLRVIARGYSRLGRKRLDVEWENWKKRPDTVFCSKPEDKFKDCYEIIAKDSKRILYTFDLIAKHVFKNFKKPFDGEELKKCFLKVPSLSIEALRVVSKSYESLVGEIAKKDSKVIILCGNKDDSEFILKYDKVKKRFKPWDVLEVEVPYIFKAKVAGFLSELGYYKLNPDKGSSLLIHEGYTPDASHTFGDSFYYNQQLKEGMSKKDKYHYKSIGIKLD